jgi:hypothetical protein
VDIRQHGHRIGQLTERNIAHQLHLLLDLLGGVLARYAPPSANLEASSESLSLSSSYFFVA